MGRYSMDIDGIIWGADPGRKHHSVSKYDTNCEVPSAIKNHPKPGGSTRAGAPAALGRKLAHPMRSPSNSPMERSPIAWILISPIRSP